MAMPSPSLEDFLAADFIAWGNNGQGASDLLTLQSYINEAEATDSSLSNWHALEVSSRSDPTWSAHGMYADAFQIGSGSTGQIVIAFQATTFEQPQLGADLNTALGKITPGLTDAVTFVENEANAHPDNQIFLTGHSLGGLEAEYAKWQLQQKRS